MRVDLIIRTAPDGISCLVWSLFERYFLLHCLADDCADGVCRVLLHLCSGVGVDVEGEAGGVVAQGSGESFHIYAVLEG